MNKTWIVVLFFSLLCSQTVATYYLYDANSKTLAMLRETSRFAEHQPPSNSANAASSDVDDELKRELSALRADLHSLRNALQASTHDSTHTNTVNLPAGSTQSVSGGQAMEDAISPEKQQFYREQAQSILTTAISAESIDKKTLDEFMRAGLYVPPEEFQTLLEDFTAAINSGMLVMDLNGE